MNSRNKIKNRQDKKEKRKEKNQLLVTGTSNVHTGCSSPLPKSDHSKDTRNRIQGKQTESHIGGSQSHSMCSLGLTKDGGPSALCELWDKVGNS